jgi:TM2 domain-containing membrane protein YozV
VKKPADTPRAPRETPPSRQAHPTGPIGTPPGAKDPNTALLLELLPGFFAATFGIGHIYLGQVARGLLIMFGYWFILVINVFLTAALIGFCTLPLCHFGIMALSAIWAYNDAKGMIERGEI